MPIATANRAPRDSRYGIVRLVAAGAATVALGAVLGACGNDKVTANGGSNGVMGESFSQPKNFVVVEEGSLNGGPTNVELMGCMPTLSADDVTGVQTFGTGYTLANGGYELKGTNLIYHTDRMLPGGDLDAQKIADVFAATATDAKSLTARNAIINTPPAYKASDTNIVDCGRTVVLQAGGAQFVDIHNKAETPQIGDVVNYMGADNYMVLAEPKT